MEQDVDLTDSMEDYLEAISVLKDKQKYVRVRDIARHMNVKMPSVTDALKSLAERDLVKHEKYEYVDLTDKGAIVALEIRRRHDAILQFLTDILGLDMLTAEDEACNMEHNISPKTLERLLKLSQCINSCPLGVPKCLSDLKSYLEDIKP